ncbi:hypothetical protein KGV52_01265 [Candidatus Gracilibacteria bacterium]|nr:hypothetical protein [Candidatus Gracilibacteria bacterium]
MNILQASIIQVQGSDIFVVPRKSKDGIVLNGEISVMDAPKTVQAWYQTVVTRNKKVKVFGDLDLLFQQKEVFTEDGFRVATSSKVNGMGILRDASIYLGNNNDVIVNLDMCDPAIAARFERPGGLNYGVLGKYDTLRGKTEEYYNIPILGIYTSPVLGFEWNLENNEQCFMSRDHIFHQSLELDEKMREDIKTVHYTAKI